MKTQVNSNLGPFYTLFARFKQKPFLFPFCLFQTKISLENLLTRFSVSRFLQCKTSEKTNEQIQRKTGCRPIDRLMGGLTEQ